MILAETAEVVTAVCAAGCFAASAITAWVMLQIRLQVALLKLEISKEYQTKADANQESQRMWEGITAILDVLRPQKRSET